MNVPVFLVAGLVAAMWLPASLAAAVVPDVARGEHLATAIAHCTDCHGADLGGGGRSFPLGLSGGLLFSSNLTAGKGGVGGAYSDADFERAIRHGVRPDGTRLSVMPSAEYVVLTDADVASLIAYIRSVPPVDRRFPRVARDGSSEPASGVTLPFPQPASPGAYLARLGGCLSCHGSELHGGTVRGSVVPDISHGGLAAWSLADFMTAMRTGQAPGGRALSEAMPWRTVGKLSDDELHALYDYLESVPARKSADAPDGRT